MYVDSSLFFFFNDTATTEIYTLSLHDALPICEGELGHLVDGEFVGAGHGEEEPPYDERHDRAQYRQAEQRSEEHTSELQSRLHLVCRLLLEKKKKKKNIN